MNDYLGDSRRQLQAMEEEFKREKFLKWASTNIKFLRKMSPDEVQILRYYYENAESWKNVVNNTFSIALDNLNSEIDYSNDLEKNRRQSSVALENLTSYIKEIEKKYEITQDDNLKM